MKKIIIGITISSFPIIAFAKGFEKIISDPITLFFMVAIALTGIYFQFKSVTSLRADDAVPRKNKLPQHIQTILRSKRLVR
jgi:hypothetical protein